MLYKKNFLKYKLEVIRGNNMKKVKLKFNIEKILIISFLISFIICLFLAYNVKSNTTLMVENAVLRKSYYSYTLAYDAVIELPEGKKKNSYLKKLNAIKGEVYTREVNEANSLIEDMVKTNSGKIYDYAMKKFSEINLKPDDRSYFYSELSRLAKAHIWTPDYLEAVNAVSDAWVDMTETNVKKAEEKVSKVELQVNKDYLTEEIAKIKKKIKEKQ